MFSAITTNIQLRPLSSACPESNIRYSFRETVAVEFKDVKSGKPLTQGEVKVKLQGPPDKVEQTRDMAGMQGHFGADFDLSKKGKYGIMCKFKLSDGKVRQVKFWYTAA